MLRPDYIFAPVFRAPVPYLAVVVLLGAAGVLQMHTIQYSDQDLIAVVIGNLLLNLAVQVVAIVAMRSIGLFYRHYSCYFSW